MESKKYNKLMNITKRKQTHRCREQPSGYQWGEGRGRGKKDVGEGKAQTAGYKIGSGMYYNAGSITNVL